MYCTECNELINKNIFKPCECDIFLHQDCVKNYVNKQDNLIFKECRDCGFVYNYDYYSRYHEILYNLNNLIYNNYNYKILGLLICNFILLFYSNLWIITLTLNISIFIDLIFIAVCSYYINSITTGYSKSCLIYFFSCGLAMINNYWMRISLYLFSLKFVYSLRRYYYINSSQYFYIQMSNNYKDTVNNFI